MKVEWTPAVVRKTILFGAMVGMAMYMIVTGQTEEVAGAMLILGTVQTTLD